MSIYYSRNYIDLRHYPGFRWDKVNFHKKPGVDIVGMADPNWANKQVIQYHVTSC